MMDLIAQIVSIAGVVVAIVCSAAALARNEKKDAGKEAAEAAKMSAILSTIQAGVDEIRIDQKTMRKDYNEIVTRVLKVEERSKSNTHRLDKMEENMDQYHPRT